MIGAALGLPLGVFLARARDEGALAVQRRLRAAVENLIAFAIVAMIRRRARGDRAGQAGEQAQRVCALQYE